MPGTARRGQSAPWSAVRLGRVSVRLMARWVSGLAITTGIAAIGGMVIAAAINNTVIDRVIIDSLTAWVLS